MIDGFTPGFDKDLGSRLDSSVLKAPADFTPAVLLTWTAGLRAAKGQACEQECITVTGLLTRHPVSFPVSADIMLVTSMQLTYWWPFFVVADGLNLKIRVARDSLHPAGVCFAWYFAFQIAA